MKISVKLCILIVKSYNVLRQLFGNAKLCTSLIDLHFRVHSAFYIIMLERRYKAIL